MINLEDILYEFLQDDLGSQLYSELIEMEKEELGIFCRCEECERRSTQLATERVDNHILEMLERNSA
jgi:hypothetical protein